MLAAVTQAVAAGDLVIVVPNLLGLVLSILQVLMILYLRRSTAVNSSEGVPRHDEGGSSKVEKEPLLPGESSEDLEISIQDFNERD